MPGLTSSRDKKFQGFDIFEVESAANALVRAETIKMDKKMFAAASKFISQRMIAERLAKLKATEKAGKG